MWDVIPVRCEFCNNKTLFIKPGDKAYCLTEECTFECTRYPTDPERELPVNRHAHHIYVHRLEEEVLAYRAATLRIDQQPAVGMIEAICDWWNRSILARFCP